MSSKKRGKTAANGNYDETDRVLMDLYHQDSQFLGEYPWEFEVARWAEMLACLWMEGLGIRPDVTRKAIGLLGELRQLDIQALAKMDETNLDFLSQALTRLQIPEETAQAAILLAVNVARQMIKRLNGYPQKLLRKHGRNLVADLARIYRESGIESRDATSAAVLFVQNACNLPVLVHDHPGVRALCSGLGVSEADLVRRADVLGLNLAVLDDLLAVQGSGADTHPSSPAPVRRKKTR